MRYPLFCCLFLLSLYSAAQNKINIQILDDLGDYIPYCEVIGEESYSTTSDEWGRAEIDTTEQLYHFISSGFIERSISTHDILLNNSIVVLDLDVEVIQDVFVTAPTRQKQLASKIPSKVIQIDAKVIEEKAASTSADLLAQSNEVFVQKSQLGGGSPIIRGFEANRVLLVLDGVRLNNAIYRSGHLQNSVTIDPLILDRAEVVFGPSAVMYGSDALGGVVHYYTKEPKLLLKEDTTEWSGNAYVKYATAAFEKKYHIDFQTSKAKWAMLNSLSVSDFEDLRTGTNGWVDYPNFGERPRFISSFEGRDTILQNRNPAIQIGTAYEQYDFLQKHKILVNDSTYLGVNVNYSISSNVPRYDRLIETEQIINEDEQVTERLKFAEWFYGPQKRFFGAVSAKFFRDYNPLYDKLDIIAAFQKIDEDRISRRFNSYLRSSQREDVFVYSLNADFVKYLSESKKASSITYGFEVKHDVVRSTAVDDNVITQESNFNVLTRYPDGGSNMGHASAYVTSNWKFGDKHTVLLGTRYNKILVEANFQDTSLYRLPLDQFRLNTSALTWSGGYAYNSDNGFTYKVTASTAFKAPNVDDFGKVRIKDGFITVPNEELKSEKSYNADLTIQQVVKDKIKWSGTVYYTYLFDAIAQENTILSNGDTLLFAQGEYNRVTTNVNAGEARLFGATGDVELKCSKHLSTKASVTYTNGLNLTNQDPLAHIPPLYGGAEVIHHFDHWTNRLVVQVNGRKPMSRYAPGNSSDNLQLATPDGTPAWWIANWYSSYQLSKSLQINGGVENILDMRYRPFSSGVSGPGRNIIIAIKGTF